MIRPFCVMLLVTATLAAQQTPPRFGGAYAGLEPVRQHLVDLWVMRVSAVTGERLSAQALYDEHVSLSVRTTFDAITHALMTSTLSDDAGAPLGRAIDLIASLESVRGQVVDAPGDRQCRM